MTPLQTRMNELGKYLSGLSFIIIAIIGIIGISQGHDWLDVFNVAVSLAVAAIPEGLPVVVVVTLALGVIRMSSYNAIVKKLPSVEGLGSIDILCIDKTGTLTENKMVATLIFIPHGMKEYGLEALKEESALSQIAVMRLLEICNLCNNSFLDDYDKWNGQPTEVAIMDLLKEVNIPDMRNKMKKKSEIPFSPEQKWMAVEVETPDMIGNQKKSLFYCKGAIETILNRCSYMYSPSSQTSLTKELLDEFLHIEQNISSRGLRVIAFSFGEELQNMTFAGFVAMYDPPRPGCAQIIEQLHRSQIQVIMITGDSCNLFYFFKLINRWNCNCCC
jgi:Ca2+-transporting ATPase